MALYMNGEIDCRRKYILISGPDPRTLYPPLVLPDGQNFEVAVLYRKSAVKEWKMPIVHRSS